MYKQNRAWVRQENKNYQSEKQETGSKGRTILVEQMIEEECIFTYRPGKYGELDLRSNKIIPDGHRENGRWKLGRIKYTGLRVYL